MPPLACTTDSEARVVLPASFADSDILIEEVSETELRIRKTAPTVFAEEMERKPLTDRDRDILLAMLENPPPPNEALKALFERHKDRG